MAETYIGEIRIFAGYYAPKNWAYCYGQLLTIAENQALFSLIGTTYGGDGYTNFALPDFRGRIPVGMGAGPNLTPRPLGQMFGVEQAPLDKTPLHTHNFQGSTLDADDNIPSAKVLAKTPAGTMYYEEIDGDEDIIQMKDDTIKDTGGGSSHYNMMPALSMNYIIALKGTYPPRP